MDLMLKRHIAKTITYRLLSSMIGFLVVYVITDSHISGIVFSITELLYKPLQYFIHERIWYRYIRFGLKEQSGRKYALFIGRWQTWHEGHEWLIRQQLSHKKDVWLAIRNVPVDENNPKSADRVMRDIMATGFYKANRGRIMVSIINDIESVNYGRNVGYDVIYHEPPEEIAKVSGTQIRKQQDNHKNQGL